VGGGFYNQSKIKFHIFLFNLLIFYFYIIQKILFKKIFFIYIIKMNPQSSAPAPRANPQMNPNAKLSSVKYTSILPSGKLNGYTEGEKVRFDIPATIPYFDGSQSYISMTIQNNSNWSGNVQDGTSTYAGSMPCAFPPNMGANALISRMQINDNKGMSLENLEAYNLYNSLFNAYCNDTDTFPALAKVEGVAGRNNSAHNLQAIDPKVNYFFAPSFVDTTDKELDATNLGSQRDNTFCIPVMSGLYGFYSGEQNAFPNLDIGGHSVELFLEEADVIMNCLASSYPTYPTINGQVYRQVDKVVMTTPVVKGIGDQNTTTTSVITEANGNPIDTSIDAFSRGETWTPEMIGWRVGQVIRISGGTLAAGGELATITKVEYDEKNAAADAAGIFIKLTHTAVSQADGTSLQLEDTNCNRQYVINDIQLKILETTPDAGTMKQIRSALSKGINYTTYQLNKVSTPAQLVNSVLDIPTPLTRGLSIFDVPIQSANIKSKDSANSYVWCRTDAVLNSNNNQYNYVWQVANTLIPNREVQTSSDRNNNSDNSIYYTSQAQAFRPLRPVKAFGDVVLDNQMSNAVVFPILVAPVGSSYDLSQTEVQLRIGNSDTTGANVSAKLHHVFLNHVRMMVANDSGVDIQL